MGNSVKRSLSPATTPVHPHVHGELPLILSGLTSLIGSSPRAWGTPSSRGRCRADRRFIPTCMGNSFQFPQGCRILPVHPHVHGELLAWAFSASVAAGSSPRAWGTLGVRHRRPGILRFIPTCMGNSPGRARTLSYLPVHPHVHGELGLTLDGRLVCIGSSPRAWGTLRPAIRERDPHRFIPTCMGNSGAVLAVRSAGSVHPHVHGELPAARRARCGALGSSPRAWGTRIYAGTQNGVIRFIPTCMGNSKREIEED